MRYKKRTLIYIVVDLILESVSSILLLRNKQNAGKNSRKKFDFNIDNCTQI